MASGEARAHRAPNKGRAARRFFYLITVGERIAQAPRFKGAFQRPGSPHEAATAKYRLSLLPPTDIDKCAGLNNLLKSNRLSDALNNQM